MEIRLIVPNVFPNVIESYGPEIAEIAGGFTATQAVGGWKDNQGNLIVEPVTVFDMSCDYSADWVSLARMIATELHQDCVYLRIGEVVSLVKPAE